jgi:hypothetical protein
MADSKQSCYSDGNIDVFFDVPGSTTCQDTRVDPCIRPGCSGFARRRNATTWKVARSHAVEKPP